MVKMLFKLNKSKAVESLLFVCRRLEIADKHKVSKILYYADKAHLDKFGRLITGDEYTKMEYGPVPSWIYDLIKENERTPKLLEVKGYTLNPLRKERQEELSESDIECLLASIDKHGHKSFSELKEESHDESWHSGTINQKFSGSEFLETFPDREEIEDYLKNGI